MRIRRDASPRIPAACGHGEAWPREKDRSVTKKNDKTIRQRRDHVVGDWQPLFAALKDVIDWALDIAARLARDYDEDVEAIERVRLAFHAWLDGRPCEMDTRDLLLTFATILSQIEIDLGIDSPAALEPLSAVIAMQPTRPRALRFPGTTRDELPTVVIRRFPGRRNASAAFTQLAA